MVFVIFNYSELLSVTLTKHVPTEGPIENVSLTVICQVQCELVQHQTDTEPPATRCGDLPDQCLQTSMIRVLKSCSVSSGGTQTLSVTKLHKNKHIRRSR
jgi:hypothetical protein